jgi:outer membrane protein assembly factor BamB
MSNLDSPPLARDGAVSRETVVAALVATPPSVSRETSRRRSKTLLIGASLAFLAIFAAACSKAAGPVGWAGAVPVTVGSQKLILVNHTGHLYALKDGSSNAQWQFPPKDKSTYPVSAETAAHINTAIDAFSIDAGAKTDLKQKVTDLTVSGPTAGALKDAIKASGATDKQKSDTSSLIDDALSFEQNALGNLKALYGDTAVSSDGKTTYVPSFGGMLFAIDTATGNARWIRNVGAAMVGGVAVDGDNIYFGTRANRLYAVNGTTGEQVWAFKTAGEVWATPTIDNKILYVTSLDGSLYAIDETGKQKWVFSSSASGIAARAVVAGDAVYIGSFDDKLYSVKTSDGTMNWSIKAGNWFWAAPVVDKGVVYAASLDGKVYAVDVSTGASKWSHPFDTTSAIRSSPVIAGNGLVVAARSGRVYKLDLASGEPADNGTSVDIGQSILANLSTSGDNTVYVLSSSAVLYVLDVSGALTAPGSYPLPN